jgi:hypothetical protein
MYITANNKTLISCLLVLSFLLGPFVPAVEASVFGTLTTKIQNRVEEVQQREWWFVKVVSSVSGFVAGKAGGALGAAVGYVLGASVGGPLAAGMGAMIGYKLGDIVTKTFAKALGEAVAKRKLVSDEEVTIDTITDTFKTLDLGALSAESVGGVLGDFIGGSLGATLGVMMLASFSTLTVPLLGVVSGAYIGSKLGKSIGRSIGRFIGSVALKSTYRYAAEAFMETEPNPEEGWQEVANQEPVAQGEIKKPANPDSTRGPTENLQELKQAYEQAYRAYTAGISSSDTSLDDRNELLARYREAYDAYISAFSLTNSK